MQHVTFARFPDRQRALEGIRTLRAQTLDDTQIVLHWGPTDAESFEQMVQHSGDFGDTDQRHALLVGCVTGLLLGATLGAILAAVGLFPGLLVGVGLGSLMGLLVGLVMMVLIGTGLVDRRLKRLTRDLQTGEIVLTVYTKELSSADSVKRALEESGALVAEKGVA